MGATFLEDLVDGASTATACKAESVPDTAFLRRGTERLESEKASAAKRGENSKERKLSRKPFKSKNGRKF